MAFHTTAARDTLALVGQYPMCEQACGRGAIWFVPQAADWYKDRGRFSGIRWVPLCHWCELKWWRGTADMIESGEVPHVRYRIGHAAEEGSLPT